MNTKRHTDLAVVPPEKKKKRRGSLRGEESAGRASAALTNHRVQVSRG